MTPPLALLSIVLNSSVAGSEMGCDRRGHEGQRREKEPVMRELEGKVGVAHIHNAASPSQPTPKSMLFDE